jgi:hypothetical protein
MLYTPISNGGVIMLESNTVKAVARENRDRFAQEVVVKKETPNSSPNLQIKTQSPISPDNITISNKGKLLMTAQILKDWALTVNKDTSSFTIPANTFISGARLGSQLSQASKMIDQAFSKEAAKMEDLSLKAAQIVQKRKNDIVNADESLNSFKLLQKTAIKLKDNDFEPVQILPDIERVIGSLKNMNRGTRGEVEP